MTGKRGPISGTKYGAKSGPAADAELQRRLGNKPRNVTASVVPVQGELTGVVAIPDPPDSLPAEVHPLWVSVWRAFPASMLSELDYPSILRFCELTHERTVWSALVMTSPLLREPIVSPRGDVVGEKIVPNPAAKELRAVDRVLNAFVKELGLSPAARARLGWTVSSARLANAEANRILEGLSL